jgi:hypothetical protein
MNNFKCGSQFLFLPAFFFPQQRVEAGSVEKDAESLAMN